MRADPRDLVLHLDASPVEWAALLAEVAKLERAQLPVALALAGEWTPMLGAEMLRRET